MESDLIPAKVDIKEEVITEECILLSSEDECQDAAPANAHNGNPPKVIEDSTPTSSNDTKCEPKRKVKSSYRSFLSVKPFRCHVCQKRFMQKCNLDKHMVAHGGAQPYKCDICQKEFTQKRFLNRHTAATHSGVKPFKCDSCHKCFKLRSNLKVHILSTHTVDRPFKCDVCVHAFDNFRVQHVLAHGSGKLFKCDQCVKVFLCEHELTEHGHVHTDGPFKCGTCHMTFDRRIKFARHVVTKKCKSHRALPTLLAADGLVGLG